MFCVVRTVDQGDSAMAGGAANWFPHLGVLIQLPKIASLELAPLFRIVREPLAKRGARRHLLEPCIKAQVGFLCTTRPESLHQEPNAVFRRCFVVDAFQSKHFTPPWRLREAARVDRSQPP